MINSVHFKDYRNFTDFSMTDLKRVNLIVGNSNVGKTGLLEGLVVLWGTEQQYDELPKTFRMSNGDVVENYWSWLFPEKNRTLSPAFTAIDDRNTLIDITINKNFFLRQERTISKKLYEPTANKLSILPAVIANQSNRIVQEDTSKKQLIAALKTLEPRLQGLEYLTSPNSDKIMIYADIGLEYKIPTTQFGHGFTHSMEMLSNLILSNSSIMIADEIENGIHYSALTAVWKALINYAVTHDTQIFATTHSRECIAAAHQAMLEQPQYALNVIRLQQEQSKIVAINHNQEEIEVALDQGLELR